MKIFADDMFWNQILALISEGRVIPIVGRDLLMVKYQDREVLLYPLIAQKLAEYLDVFSDDLPEGDEINTVVYRYIEQGKQIEDVYSALKIIMIPLADLPIPDSLKKLAEIRPFRLFVTTTFDSLLEQAISEVRFSGHPGSEVYSYTPNNIEDLPGPLKQKGPPKIYHLFGKISAIPSFAVTQEDILEFMHSLQSNARQPNVLFDELNRSNLLILGCSFGDWLARFFIRTAKRQRLLEVRGSTDYIVDAKVSGDQGLILFLKYYSKRTKVYEGSGAVDFISELHRRWMERDKVEETRTRQKFEQVLSNRVSGAIFISYANEDMPAVIKIRTAFEAEGMTVFFDKNELKAGDEYEVKIKQTIGDCAIFIPVISKNTSTDERRFFRIEWYHAIEESRKAAPTERFIVPIAIDDTSTSDESIPEKFRTIQWERVPGGQMNPEFLGMIKKLYRRYHKGE